LRFGHDGIHGASFYSIFRQAQPPGALCRQDIKTRSMREENVTTSLGPNATSIPTSAGDFKEFRGR
jgi:hypothetical protein